MRRVNQVRMCPVCELPYSPIYTNQVCCGPLCGKDHAHRRTIEYQQRKIQWFTCQHCGNLFRRRRGGVKPNGTLSAYNHAYPVDTQSHYMLWSDATA